MQSGNFFGARWKNASAVMIWVDLAVEGATAGVPRAGKVYTNLLTGRPRRGKTDPPAVAIPAAYRPRSLRRRRRERSTGPPGGAPGGRTPTERRRVPATRQARWKPV